MAGNTGDSPATSKKAEAEHHMSEQPSDEGVAKASGSKETEQPPNKDAPEAQRGVPFTKPRMDASRGVKSNQDAKQEQDPILTSKEPHKEPAGPTHTTASAKTYNESDAPRIVSTESVESTKKEVKSVNHPSQDNVSLKPSTTMGNPVPNITPTLSPPPTGLKATKAAQALLSGKTPHEKGPKAYHHGLQYMGLDMEPAAPADMQPPQPAPAKPPAQPVVDPRSRPYSAIQQQGSMKRHGPPMADKRTVPAAPSVASLPTNDAAQGRSLDLMAALAENILEGKETMGDKSTDIKSLGVDAAKKRKSRRNTPSNFPVYYVSEVGEYDVLLGRGGKSNHHAGNKRYRDLISKQRPIYQTLTSKSAKTQMSHSIVDYICHKGRFLEKDEATGRFCIVTKAKAITKTSQALRETKQFKWKIACRYA